MSEYKLEWEKTSEGSARLLRVEEIPTELALPDEIEGLPLTEVGPYCFAKNKFLERVTLPDSVVKISKMAFYNCTALKELELGKGLVELGADAFMNCHNLHLISVRCKAQEKSGVRLILQQISSDLRVHFLGNQNGEEAKLLFTEYYETYDEVAPAHLFGRNIEGEGFRARRCFREGILDFERYDSIFPKACAEETTAALCEMAMNRICYPVGLNEKAKKDYIDYVKTHLDNICKKAVLDRDMNTLLFLCENELMEKMILEQCVRLAAEYEWAEGGAYILRLKERFFPQGSKKNRYAFDDF